jgi:hypothetical protein
MPYHLRNELTGDVAMVGSNDPPSIGTRFRHAADGGFVADAEGSFVVIGDEEGHAAMIANPEDAWRQLSDQISAAAKCEADRRRDLLRALVGDGEQAPLLRKALRGDEVAS